MITIINKELNILLSSLKGYLAISFFLISCSILLWVLPNTSILYHHYADLQTMFDYGPYISIILCSSLTMDIWASEKNSSMLESLIVMPINLFEIIIGKYFAVVIILFFSLILSFIYYISIYLLANPVGSVDTLSIAISYLGFFLLSSFFLAISVFGSSLNKNQFISFIINVILCFIFYNGYELLAKNEVFSKYSFILSNLGAYSHYYSLRLSLIDSRDIVYFLVVIFTFLFLTSINLRIFREYDIF